MDRRCSCGRTIKTAEAKVCRVCRPKVYKKMIHRIVERQHRDKDRKGAG
jgi:hypothetical protein